MTSKHGESDKQQNAADHEDRTTPQQHSQTLPLITEELAASRCATETERSQAPSQHATTPVMPPNPIRRETPLQDTAVQGAPSVRGASSTASTAHPTETRLAPAAAHGPDPEDEKKSEGRISATQLLAGAGAAATSSVVGGQLGVAGTVVGAGIASIITGLAVTIYGRSLDKGKEKIKEVGSKLAPAVKAQMAKGGPGAKTGTAQGVRSESAFASAPATDDTAATEAATAPAPAEGSTGTATETSRTWWQKLRRKRVLYPVTIGVAAFGIGLGAVVMAESVTGADISPGTSQISRAVSGNTGSAEETGTDGGSEGSSDSGSSGSGAGSQSGTDSNTGTVNEGSNEGGAASAGEGETEGTTTGAQTDQGSDASSSAGSDASASTSSDGTDTSGASSTSNGSGSQGQGGSDASGGGSSSDGGAGGGSGSGGDSSTGGSSGSGASSAQG